MRKEKGITLIALIITIIVMLILVGVTVNVALNGGLFTKAKEATKSYTAEEEKELIQVGYSDYHMQKYSPQKTEDFDMLETYFLGQEKEGLNLENLLDYDENIDGMIYYHFKNIDIVVPDSDIKPSEDNEDYALMHFEYNNHKYKLTFNGNNSITQKLEVEPILQVQDATVTEEEDGWKIAFNSSSNTYLLLNDGTVVSNAWWKLTEEENQDIVYDNDMGGYAIAKGSKGNVALVYDKDAIYILLDDNMEYSFILTDYGKEQLEGLSGIAMEKYKWYYGKDSAGDISNCKEYTGSSPISLDDFTTIISESYLQRIIDSFGNQ